MTRSRAWIEGFSSTQMTTAFSGSAAGFRGNSLVPAREGG